MCIVGFTSSLFSSLLWKLNAIAKEQNKTTVQIKGKWIEILQGKTCSRDSCVYKILYLMIKKKLAQTRS